MLLLKIALSQSLIDKLVKMMDKIIYQMKRVTLHDIGDENAKILEWMNKISSQMKRVALH